MHRRFGVKHKYDHLVCFVPGMLGLGAHHGAVTGDKADRYMAAAAELTRTCWQMYRRMPTGGSGLGAGAGAGAVGG